MTTASPNTVSVPGHFIMGTAGHIDHGKTALIRALTGIECDTHREEKQRGITIHLGFAHLDMPSGDSIGIVDVPGHAAFIRTMVAGASGIDFCLLVVAADSGVMPQTREHLQIMQILGVKTGIVALTKIDLVESDVRDMAVEEIRELTQGTFLENCAIIPVSAKTGDGLPALRESIATQVSTIPSRSCGKVFRMFIDRIFTVKGFGTVVNGSVQSGTLGKDAPVFLLPAGKELRVRRLERHGKETETIRAGDRAAINCAGLNAGEFHRGMLLSDRILRSTVRIDAQLTLFKQTRTIGLWSQAIFYLGTFEAQARIHLLDRNTLSGSETSLVQIHLPQPCIAQAGDKFVIRSTSSDITLGGGDIIDAFPLHHRRRPSELINDLAIIAGGKLPDLIAAAVRKSTIPLDTAEIAGMLNTAVTDIKEANSGGLPDDIVCYRQDSDFFLHSRTLSDTWRRKIVQEVIAYHRRNPLEPGGPSLGRILGTLGLSAGDHVSELVVRQLLAQLVSQGELEESGTTWKRIDHKAVISPELRKRLDFLESFLENSGMKTPLMSELTTAASAEGIDTAEMPKLLRYLCNGGSIYCVDNNYLHASIVDSSRIKLKSWFQQNPARGITVAQFRDLVGGNRKICLLLLAQFDREGATRRDGDMRFSAE